MSDIFPHLSGAMGLVFKAIFIPAGDLYVQVNVASYPMQRRFQVLKQARARGCEYLHWQFSEITSQIFAHISTGSPFA